VSEIRFEEHQDPVGCEEEVVCGAKCDRRRSIARKAEEGKGPGRALSLLQPAVKWQTSGFGGQATGLRFPLFMSACWTKTLSSFASRCPPQRRVMGCGRGRAIDMTFFAICGYSGYAVKS